VRDNPTGFLAAAGRESSSGTASRLVTCLASFWAETTLSTHEGTLMMEEHPNG
jgi:hypothetical protein